MNTHPFAKTMKAVLPLCLALMVPGITRAATVNIPPGLTGLWRFENSTNLGGATVGNNLMFSNSIYGSQWLGPWTEIGGEGWLTRYSDGAIFQEVSLSYLAVDPGFTVSGGSTTYANDYTVAIDYQQTSTGLAESKSNSVFQTSRNGNATDGDLWIYWQGYATYTNCTIGSDALGYSTTTFDASKWHRIVWSVSNGNFFRVYVDGTLVLEGTPQPIDGRYAVYPDRFNLFADNDWNDAWGYVGTIATWNRALTTAEVNALGGWIGGAGSPTPLVYSNTPEVSSVWPADGATNVAPEFAYQALIFDPVQIVDRNSLELLLDGFPVTPAITGPTGSISVEFSAGGQLQAGSTHTYTLTGSVSGGAYFTNEVTFTVRPSSSHIYEWDFSNGDLSPSLGNGIMSYYGDAASLTSFGETDGSTVPHINGSPAKYMHVPGFSFDSDFYQLEFSNSGPNGTGGYLNLYTLVMDLRIPSPWLNDDYMVPFFNTEPYNLNDADFYLRTNGAVGIGSYSSSGAVTPDAWMRLAIVADLQANTLSCYVNGTQVYSRAADGLDGRWALYSNQDSGPDLMLFNEGDISGVYTHELYLSSLAFVDRALSGSEIAGLGEPKANGIFTAGPATPPSLTISFSGGAATLSWPAAYSGYGLEQSAALPAPQWAPVPGVTNNSVTITTGSAPRFFRLRK